MSKRRQTVIDQGHLSLIRNIMFFLGMGCTSLGSWLMVANPQFSNPEQNTRLYEAGKSRKEVLLYKDRTSANIGLGLSLLGLASTGLSVIVNQGNELDKPAPLVKSGEKISKELPERTPEIPEEKKTQVKKSLTDHLLNHTLNQEWLCQTFRSPAVVIVGNPGSGKSRLAMTIAYLQQIMNQGEGILIGDPDGLANIRKGTWLAGTIYGARAEIEDQQSELLAVIRKHQDANRTDQSPWQTIIWDEFSKWDSMPLVNEKCEEVLKYGLQATRKRNQSTIFLLHHTNKGMAGGNTQSGVLSSLLTYAAVIYLPTIVKPKFGSPPRSETLWFKMPGTPLSSNDSLPTLQAPGNWEYFNLPLALDPATFKEAYGKILPLFGLDKVQTIQEVKKGQEREEFEEMKAEVTQQFPGILALENREKLERLLTLTPDISTENLLTKLSTEAKEIYDYVSQSKNYQVDQDLPVVRILDNMRKHGKFQGKGSKATFLEVLTSSPGISLSPDQTTFKFIKGD